MDLKIANVTVDSARPRELADWWAEALGGEVVTDYGEYLTVGFGEGVKLSFQLVEGTSPGRIHLDLESSDVAKETRRLIDAGASHVADHEIPGADFRWTVLADPDGNEFCVVAGH